MDSLRAHKLTATIMIFSIMLILPPRASVATEISATESVLTSSIQLSSGKSIVLKSDTPIKRVSVANPEVADFILLSPREIYLTGKSAGTTNITLWQDSRVVAVYDLNVGYNVSRFKQHLNEVLPNEKDLQVLAANDSITLSGKISNAANLSQALSLARAYAPEGKVQDLVQVGGVHQVMLEVRVAEMSRTLTRRLGINLFFNDASGQFGVSTLGSLASLVTRDQAHFLTGSGLSGWQASPAVNALFRFNQGDNTWTGLIDALKEDGLIKVLAEPTLVTLSGQSASFLAGGEFPVPVPQGLGTVGIEYKKFGVMLGFSPTVLSSDKISINVNPEVSEIDFTTAITLQGFVIPGLRTRRTATTVELGDGQSFAIAGLLRDNMRSISSKWPLLGELPILGALFQSKSFQKEETELIIIVTPHLVKPLNVAKQTLPTDFYVEPNDAEFYVLGRLEGDATKGAKSSNGNMDGDFGHSMPKN
ncbi:MAG: type II and III secretion system protein family protein [Deltaproteobacteria bacterium]|nr:type II and III secretion system protein family protein [Deltaproteobacteria bacterium]